MRRKFRNNIKSLLIIPRLGKLSFRLRLEKYREKQNISFACITSYEFRLSFRAPFRMENFSYTLNVISFIDIKTIDTICSWVFKLYNLKMTAIKSHLICKGWFGGSSLQILVFDHLSPSGEWPILVHIRIIISLPAQRRQAWMKIARNLVCSLHEGNTQTYLFLKFRFDSKWQIT